MGPHHAERQEYLTRPMMKIAAVVRSQNGGKTIQTIRSQNGVSAGGKTIRPRTIRPKNKKGKNLT